MMTINKGKSDLKSENTSTEVTEGKNSQLKMNSTATKKII